MKLIPLTQNNRKPRRPRAIDFDAPASSREYKREYNRLYRLSHPHVGRNAQARYRINHREKVLKAGRDYMRRIRKERPIKVHANDRRQALWRNYGISIEQYDELFKYQNGVCAVCGGHPDSKKGYLCVDHNHKTGALRGLLCLRCNAALGQVRDNLTVLKTMIQYLSKYETTEINKPMPA